MLENINLWDLVLCFVDQSLCLAANVTSYNKINSSALQPWLVRNSMLVSLSLITNPVY
jgi:hypothetical protein